MTTTTGRAGWLLLALTLLNVLNLADRYLLIAFSTTIVPDLGLSHLQFGLLTGFVFTGIYTVFGLFAGALADRMDRTYVIGLGVVLWSGLTAATGAAKNFVQIALARLFIGVGEACLTPAALSMLADAFPPGRRALVSSVYYFGLPIGVGGAFLFAATAGPVLGWRGSFLLLGVLGVVAGMLVIVFMTDPPREAQRTAQHANHGPGDRLTAARRDELRAWVKETFPQSRAEKTDWRQGLWTSFAVIAREVRANPAFALALAGTAFMFFSQGAGVLDLLWWVKERGYAPVEAQRLIGLMFLVGGVLGAVLGGLGSDFTNRKVRAGRLWFLAMLCAVSVPMTLVYRVVPGHSIVFYALALLSALVSVGIYGPAVSTVQDLVPAQHRGLAVAVFILIGALVGAGGGNATVGWLSDTFAAAGDSEPITHALLACQSVGLLAILAFTLAARLDRREAPAAIPVSVPA